MSTDIVQTQVSKPGVAIPSFSPPAPQDDVVYTEILYLDHFTSSLFRRQTLAFFPPNLLKRKGRGKIEDLFVRSARTS